MKNTGKNYENFVASIQTAIFQAEQDSSLKNINIQTNKIITDNNGNKREFDIYWKFKAGGVIYETVIECKDYQSTVGIDKIDGIIGKIGDIPNLRAIFATTKGYQSGAKSKAENNGIELLIVRKQNDSDWASKDGTPYIKTINIRGTAIFPARIISFDPVIDMKWVDENTNFNDGDTVELKGLNNQIFINDLDRQERYSLHDLENKKLVSSGDKKYGNFENKVKLNNAFFETQDLKVKILGYIVKYYIAKPYIHNTEIDLSANILGVVENIQKGTKQTVLNDGSVQME